MLLKNNTTSDIGDPMQPTDYTQYFYTEMSLHLSHEKDLLTLV